MKRPEPVHFSAPLREVHLAPTTASAVKLTTEYERGRLAGEEALREQLLQQRADLVALQNGVLAALRDTLPQVARECEAALVDFALEAARRLVAGLPVSAELVAAAVREAVAQAMPATEFQIFLHPEDLALLETANAPAQFPGVGAEQLRFQAAPDVSRGGCLVRTRFGVIDASRETKVAALRKAFVA